MRRHCDRLDGDDPGRPHLTDILNRWWSQITDIRLRYCVGIFHQREKLWIATNTEPQSALSAELPDVAGGLLRQLASHPAGLDAAPYPSLIEKEVTAVLELSGDSERETDDRSVTVIAPLRADLYVFVSAAGVVNRVQQLVEQAAQYVRRPWLLPKDLAAKLSLPKYPTELDVLELSATAAPLKRPGNFRHTGDELPPELDKWAPHVAEIGHRFEILAFVLARRACSWTANCSVGGARYRLSSSLTDHNSRDMKYIAYLPKAVTGVAATSALERTLHWQMNDFIDRKIVRIGSEEQKMLEKLLHRIGQMVTQTQLNVTTVDGSASEKVSHKFSQLMSGLKKKVNRCSRESNIEMESPGGGHYRLRMTDHAVQATRGSTRT